MASIHVANYHLIIFDCERLLCAYRNERTSSHLSQSPPVVCIPAFCCLFDNAGISSSSQLEEVEDVALSHTHLTDYVCEEREREEGDTI